jgi:hypothetical protein
MDKKSLIVIIALSILGIGTHLLPHAYGFTTVGAVSLLAAAYLPRHLIPVPVLITVIAADLMIGGYALVSMLIVYVAHTAAALGVHFLCRTGKPARLAGAAVMNAVIFYLVSNLAPLASGFYPADLGGIMLCYTMALPFLAKGIAANLIFGSLFFGAIFIARKTEISARRVVE